MSFQLGTDQSMFMKKLLKAREISTQMLQKVQFLGLTQELGKVKNNYENSK